MRKELKKIFLDLYYIEGSEKSLGMNPDMSGDCYFLSGDCSFLKGYCSDLEGNLDECEITEGERKRGVDILDLVLD